MLSRLVGRFALGINQLGSLSRSTHPQSKRKKPARLQLSQKSSPEIATDCFSEGSHTTRSSVIEGQCRPCKLRKERALPLCVEVATRGVLDQQKCSGALQNDQSDVIPSSWLSHGGCLRACFQLLQLMCERAETLGCGMQLNLAPAMLNTVCFVPKVDLKVDLGFIRARSVTTGGLFNPPVVTHLALIKPRSTLKSTFSFTKSLYQSLSRFNSTPTLSRTSSRTLSSTVGCLTVVVSGPASQLRLIV